MLELLILGVLGGALVKFITDDGPSNPQPPVPQPPPKDPALNSEFEELGESLDFEDFEDPKT